MTDPTSGGGGLPATGPAGRGSKPPALADRPRIRAARADDLRRVADLERASFANPWSLSSFRTLLDREGVAFLVAEAPSSAAEPAAADSGILGYGILWAVHGEAELADLAVDSAVRGRGVGGALLDAVLRHARERGVAVVFLEVRESNHGAVALYRSRGFRQVGVRSQYYTRPREDALVLRLDLSSDATGEVAPSSPTRRSE